LASTNESDAGPPTTHWRAAGLRYHSLNFFFAKKFGHRVWKVSLDGGFGCPNADGTLGVGGCVFCNIASYSPSRRLGTRSITGQLDEGIRRLAGRRKVERFVAYFQPATNTYAPVERLKCLYQEALGHPAVVGLAVGTRPDCVPDEVLDLLADLARRTWVSLELGLQSIHQRSLDWLNRRHGYGAFTDAVARSRRRGLRVVAHVILGLPGESREDMQATARELARLRVDGVKLHNLYAAKDTPLAGAVTAGAVRLPDLPEYAGYAADFLEELPPECVVERLSGEAAAEYLVAPRWCLHKPAVRAAIEAEFARRGTRQGRRFQAM